MVDYPILYLHRQQKDRAPNHLFIIILEIVNDSLRAAPKILLFLLYLV